MQTPLELRHLHTLRALSELGSLARAAERLCVTPSALSHQIKALEEHYGAPLFERNTKPVRLTAVGRRLLGLAESVLPQVIATEREIAQWVSGRGGTLRVAVECHTCFDWLMPAMDRFRDQWPDVELDLVGGFQRNPLALIEDGLADFVVIHEAGEPRPAVVVERLFRYETLAILAPRHPLAEKPFLTPEDFAQETLISYPVPDTMLDVVRHFLMPARVHPRRRTAELTVAILQLVASGRGIAALPAWSVVPYLQRGYVVGRRLGQRGLFCDLYAAVPESLAHRVYLRAFMALIREDSSALDEAAHRAVSSLHLEGIR